MPDLRLETLLRAGDRIVIGQGAGEPVELVRLLREAVRAVAGLSVFAGISESGLIDSEFASSATVSSYAAMGTLRKVAAAGLLKVIPCHYAGLPELMRTIQPDVVLVQVSPADAAGWHSLGVSADFAPAAFDGARLVLAEINDQVPRPRGAPTLHSSRISAAISSSRPLVGVPVQAAGPAEKAVAEHVASLVPDDATVQLGIGAMAAAVATSLLSHRRLRIHSALVGDWLMDMHESGTLAPGKGRDVAVLAGAALGSPELYRFMQDCRRGTNRHHRRDQPDPRSRRHLPPGGGELRASSGPYRPGQRGDRRRLLSRRPWRAAGFPARRAALGRRQIDHRANRDRPWRPGFRASSSGSITAGSQPPGLASTTSSPSSVSPIFAPARCRKGRIA